MAGLTAMNRHLVFPINMERVHALQIQMRSKPRKIIWTSSFLTSTATPVKVIKMIRRSSRLKCAMSHIIAALLKKWLRLSVKWWRPSGLRAPPSLFFTMSRTAFTWQMLISMEALMEVPFNGILPVLVFRKNFREICCPMWINMRYLLKVC